MLIKCLLSTVVAVIMVTPFVAGGCDRDRSGYAGHAEYIRTPTSHGEICYGVVNGELTFAVFDIVPNEQPIESIPKFRPIIGPRRKGLIQISHGEIVGSSASQSSACQLFEFRDGKHYERSGHVSVDELEAY